VALNKSAGFDTANRLPPASYSSARTSRLGPIGAGSMLSVIEPAAVSMLKTSTSLVVSMIPDPVRLLPPEFSDVAELVASLWSSLRYLNPLFDVMI
jgi:hypothetical protein